MRSNKVDDLWTRKGKGPQKTVQFKGNLTELLIFSARKEGNPKEPYLSTRKGRGKKSESTELWGIGGQGERKERPDPE